MATSTIRVDLNRYSFLYFLFENDTLDTSFVSIDHLYGIHLLILFSIELFIIIIFSLLLLCNYIHIFIILHTLAK